MNTTNSFDNKHELDAELESDLRHLKSALDDSEMGAVDSVIDKQIIAAANRELDRKRPTEYRISFWRKLALPLYIGSGMVFTVLAYNTLLFPEPTYKETTHSETTIVKMQSEEITEKDNVEAVAREKRELPALENPSVMPERVITQSESSAVEIGSSELDATELLEKGIYTGNELKKADYPEQDAWARDIIELLKAGSIESAKSELNRFKQVYPDYPIEEQIKALTR